MFGKMAYSPSYTFDRLSPSSSSTSGSSTESGVGHGGEEVNRIRVQPHRVSKDKKPILDYDSNDDFDDYDTQTGKPAILQLQEFDDLSDSPQEGWMEDFSIATQEDIGRRFPKVPQESRGGFPQATQENSGQFPQATKDNSGGRFLQSTPINSAKISRVTCGRNGMCPTSNMIATAKPIFI
jgi:hypothetical protein